MNSRLFLVALVLGATELFGQNIRFVPKPRGEKEVEYYQQSSVYCTIEHKLPFWGAYNLNFV